MTPWQLLQALPRDKAKSSRRRPVKRRVDEGAILSFMRAHNARERAKKRQDGEAR